MPGFRYRATGSDGKPLRGVIDADSLDDAQRRLSNRGWSNVQVVEAVLPKPREHREFVEPPSRRVTPIVLLLLLLLIALAAFIWLDPLDLQLLEQYGLRPGR